MMISSKASTAKDVSDVANKANNEPYTTPISTPASIFEIQEECYSPYVSLAILYLPELHENSWRAILDLANTLSPAVMNAITEQIVDAANALPISQRRQLIKNAHQCDQSNWLIDSILKSVSTSHQAN